MRTYYFGDKSQGIVSYFTGEDSTNTVYSDRLLQWDYEKTKELKQKHFNSQSDYWSYFPADKIEAFLKEYLGKEIKLTKITEYENKSNGYPHWRFDYYDSLAT